jgi:PKD repeat protein
MMRNRSPQLSLLGLLIIGSWTTNAAVTPVLTPSRTSGVAPLAVFFDATATTADGVSRPFHDLYYKWDFGDPSSGAWATDSLSRNSATGAVSSHLFTAPGSYTVTLTVRDASGATATRQASITVQDPDAVFSGTNTISFSHGTDFAGAPAGSMTVTTSSFATAMGYAASGKRLLLRRGETWTAGNGATINCAGPGIVGAFGSGTPPLIDSPATQATIITFSGPTPRFSDWRIMDLDLDCSDRGAGVDGKGTVKEALCYRLNIRNGISGISMSDDILNYDNDHGYPGHTHHDKIAIVECVVTRCVGGGGCYLSFIAAQRLMIMGSWYSHSEEGEHVLRTPYIGKGVISHNVLRDQAGSKHVIKMHAPQWDVAGLGYHQYTEQVELSDNLIVGQAAWTMGIGPQGGGSGDERVRDVMIERNTFGFEDSALGGQGTQCHIMVWARDITVRNNLFDVTNGSTGVSISQRQAEPTPLNVHVFNNTGYSSSAQPFSLVGVAPEDTGTVVMNNIASAPFSVAGRWGPAGATIISGTETDLVQSNNLAANNPGFVATSPVNANDFRLISGSPAIDAGALLPVFDDLNGNIRPVDGSGHGAASWDIGAFEYGASSSAVADRRPSNAAHRAHNLASGASPHIYGVDGRLMIRGQGGMASHGVYIEVASQGPACMTIRAARNGMNVVDIQNINH